MPLVFSLSTPLKIVNFTGLKQETGYEPVDKLDKLFKKTRRNAFRIWPDIDEAMESPLDYIR
jgi:hypothetical protein